MSEYFLTLIAAFVIISAAALLINYCRRKLRKTPHGLTGMCHKTGGTLCSSCQQTIEKKRPDVTDE